MLSNVLEIEVHCHVTYNHSLWSAWDCPQQSFRSLTPLPLAVGSLTPLLHDAGLLMPTQYQYLTGLLQGMPNALLMRGCWYLSTHCRVANTSPTSCGATETLLTCCKDVNTLPDLCGIANSLQALLGVTKSSYALHKVAGSSYALCCAQRLSGKNQDDQGQKPNRYLQQAMDTYVLCLSFIEELQFKHWCFFLTTVLRKQCRWTIATTTHELNKWHLLIDWFHAKAWPNTEFFI